MKDIHSRKLFVVIRKGENTMTAEKELQIVLTDEEGKEVKVVVADPKEGLTGADVEKIGQLAIAKKFFHTGKGRLATTYKGAQLVTKETTVLA